MDEIEALRKQFASLQATQSKRALSQQTCIDVLRHVMRRVPLLYSLDGQEYCTREQLQREVAAEVRRARRLAVIELQPLLNVDVDLIRVRCAPSRSRLVRRH
jgi:hypothetical protein